VVLHTSESAAKHHPFPPLINSKKKKKKQEGRKTITIDDVSCIERELPRDP
jgi:hypothetical protein